MSDTLFGKILKLLAIGMGLFVVACVPVAQQSATNSGGNTADKKFRTDDWVYEPNIGTPTLYPVLDGKEDKLAFPVIFLGDRSTSLKLEFDERGAQYHNYYYKLVQCNADWSVSILSDIEYVGAENFNEFRIEDYEVSLNTRTPYIHYTAILPHVKLSGNYIVMVYRDQNKDDLVLTRRFMVFDNKVNVRPQVQFSSGVDRRFTHQEVDFVVDYGRFPLLNEVINPREDVKVIVRQNGRWDNALYNLKPLFLRKEENLLDYNFFNLENNFKGGNEFRLIDMRSVRFEGMGIGKATFNNNEAHIWVRTDASRNNKTYSQLIDANGKFIIENYETRRGATEADYVYTHFSLSAPQPVAGDVYVFGMLSDWRLDKRFQMTYNDSTRNYEATVLLKQGYYSYEYVVAPPTPTPLGELYFEGSYSQTENIYDILVYYRPIGGRYDQLIGYNKTVYFGRQ